MTTEEKKELLQDFLDKLWYRDIHLIKEEQSDYGDGKSTIHYQDDEEIIERYLRNS